MDFPTSSHRSGRIGIAIAFLLTAVCTGAVVKMVHSTSAKQAFLIGIVALVCLVALAIILYWTVALLTVQYHVDRNGIRIRWGSSHLWVPMNAIHDIVPATDLGDSALPHVTHPSLAWLGNSAPRVRTKDGKSLFLRTTAPLSTSTAIITDGCVYFVSPSEPEGFAKAWRLRRPLGATQLWREHEQRTWLPGLAIWRDAVAWGLVGGALVTHLAVDAYVAFVYDRLPQMLSFHFDAFGQPDRTGDRAEIVRLPLIALVALALDLAFGFAVYRKHRVASYLIWGGGLILQLLTWGAVFTITGS